jgi:hypothetical protein
MFTYIVLRNVDALKIQQKSRKIKEKKLVLDRGQFYIYILDLNIHFYLLSGMYINCLHYGGKVAVGTMKVRKRDRSSI